MIADTEEKELLFKWYGGVEGLPAECQPIASGM